MGVRPAGLVDAKSLAEIHVRAWKAAYQGHLPQRYLDELKPSDRAVAWQRHLSDEENPKTTLVAEGNEGIQGFAIGGPSEDAPDRGELFAIYVEPSRWHQGIGTDLLREAESVFVEEGFQEAVLWVLPSNQQARGFYEKHGWSTEGTERTAEVWDLELPEVCYTKTLS